MFEVGDRVKVGFSEHVIWTFRRMYGQEGALVQPVRRQYGDGWAPHWVPLHQLKPWPEGVTPH